MELKDTAALMCSADYKERFKAEVNQAPAPKAKTTATM